MDTATALVCVGVRPAVSFTHLKNRRVVAQKITALGGANTVQGELVKQRAHRSAHCAGVKAKMLYLYIKKK